MKRRKCPACGTWTGVNMQGLSCCRGCGSTLEVVELSDPYVVRAVWLGKLLAYLAIGTFAGAMGASQDGTGWLEWAFWKNVLIMQAVCLVLWLLFVRPRPRYGIQASWRSP